MILKNKLHTAYTLHKNNQPQTWLFVYFNICVSIEYKKIRHFFKTVKFWFIQKL